MNGGIFDKAVSRVVPIPTSWIPSTQPILNYPANFIHTTDPIPTQSIPSAQPISFTQSIQSIHAQSIPFIHTQTQSIKSIHTQQFSSIYLLDLTHSTGLPSWFYLLSWSHPVHPSWSNPHPAYLIYPAYLIFPTNLICLIIPPDLVGVIPFINADHLTSSILVRSFFLVNKIHCMYEDK